MRVSNAILAEHLSKNLVENNAPITSTLRNYPMRLHLTLKGKKGQIACDQMRCVNVQPMGSKIQNLPSSQQKKLRGILEEFLVVE